MIQPDQNAQGQWAIWENGELVEYRTLVLFQGCLVDTEDVPWLTQIVSDAAKDGVKLTLAVGYRPLSKQLAARIRNVVDKSKVNDEKYIKNELEDKVIKGVVWKAKFKPLTSRPGWSMHQRAKAWDFNVTDPAEITKTLPSYPWLVKNAIKYNLIRAVKSERWHFERRPGLNMFAIVPKTDPTWDGLV